MGIWQGRCFKCGNFTTHWSEEKYLGKLMCVNCARKKRMRKRLVSKK